MSESNIAAVLDIIKEVDGTQGSTQHLSLESLILLINTERLQQLKDKTRQELEELKVRQDKVRSLHKLLRHINTATNEKGKFDCSNDQETKDLLLKVKEFDIDIKEGKYSYTKEERDRLVENIRIAADDFNIENDMQLQTISRLTNERYESYQMARSILKPLHEDKQRKAREISGRG
jgi:hypothetical protein